MNKTSGNSMSRPSLKDSSPPRVPTTPGSFAYTACAVDPYPLYAEARLTNPVCFDESQQAWIVLTYERVLWILKSSHLFSNKYSAQFDPFLAGSDGAAHAKTRSSLMPVISRFQPTTITKFTEEWMERFFWRMRSRNSFDAVGEFGIPLPRDFTADLLGLTPAEKQRIVDALAPRRTDMNSALKPVGDVLLGVMEDIRTQPREGVISALIHSKSEEPSSWDEILDTTRHLWFAGTVTLTGLIPAAVFRICQSPEVREQLVNETDKMPSLISEILRLEPPTQFLPRMAVSEIVTDEVTIPPRAMVRPCLASANRDPVFFPDPDTLDLNRPPHRHLSFGLGEHFCIGATIAKTMAAVALRRFLYEFPRARLADPQAPLVYEKSPTFRALVSLPTLKE